MHCGGRRAGIVPAAAGATYMCRACLEAIGASDGDNVVVGRRRQIAEVAASFLPRFRLGTISSRRAGRRQDSGGVAGRQIAEAATTSSRASVLPRFRLGVVFWTDGDGAVVWLTDTLGGSVGFTGEGDRNSG
jgi:hypothetical protein